MTRSRIVEKTCWLGLTLALAFGAVSCSAEEGPDATNVTRPPERLAVHVSLGSDGSASIVSITPTTRVTENAAPMTDETLHYSFRALDGTLLSEGDLDDPRHVHAEWYGNNVAQRGDALQSFSSIVLQLPGRRGVIVFTDAAGTRVGRVDVTPPVNAAPPGSVVQQLISPETDIVGSPVKVVDHGPSDRAYDILFLPEGYTRAELPRFATDVQRVVDQMFARADWGQHFHRINVWRIDVLSAETGVSTAAPAAMKNTAFALRRDPRLDRLIVAGDARGMAAATELGARVRADRIVIIANTSYGGAGGQIPVAANDPSLTNVVAHELGHSIVHLADEYFSATAPERSDAECASARPGGPNVSETSDRNSLPWRDLVAASTPIPTTDTTSSAVGAYAGGDRCATHRWRPTTHCLMSTNLNDSMCPVCQRALDTFMARYEGGAPTMMPMPPEDAGTVQPDAGSGGEPDASASMDASVGYDAGGDPGTGGPTEPAGCTDYCVDNGFYPGECIAGWFCDGQCVTYNGCSDDPSASSGSGSGGTPSCMYTCASFGYAPGQCVSGWYCDGECIVQNGCY